MATKSDVIHCHNCGCKCQVGKTFTLRFECGFRSPIDLCHMCFVMHATGPGPKSNSVKDNEEFIENYRKTLKFHMKYRIPPRVPFSPYQNQDD